MWVHRVWLLSGKTVNKDVDTSAIIDAMLGGSGILNGLALTKVASNFLIDPGNAIIKVARTGETLPLYVHFQLTAQVNLGALANNTLVWIRVYQDKINDGTLQDADGGNIAVIETGSSVPANAIQIGNVSAGGLAVINTAVQIIDAQSRIDSIVNGRGFFYTTSVTESPTNTYTLNFDKLPDVSTPADPTTISENIHFAYRSPSDNSGTVTLKINTAGGLLTAVAYRAFNKALITGDIKQNQIVVVCYNKQSNSFQVLNGVAQDPIAEANTLIEAIYPVGEDVTAGNCLFLEKVPTYTQAQFNAQNVGDVSGNTRDSTPIFGSGVSMSTLAGIALRKVVSPSVAFSIRIETDDGTGKPSGTLAHANATGSIASGTVTTSWVDTAITFAGAFTLAYGVKYHLVMFAGTYGSETVNGTNYYQVGYYTNDTATRGFRSWNGTVWSSVTTTKFIYCRGTGILDTVLAKTSASFGYKVNVRGIATETKTVGQVPRISLPWGINGNQTGIVERARYFLSNTAGAISTTPGTVTYFVGTGYYDSTRLLFNPNENISGGSMFTLVSLPTQRLTASTVYITLKSFVAPRTGTFSFTYTLQNPSSGSNIRGRFFVNGVAVGTERQRTNNTPLTTTEDLTVNEGDLVELKAYTDYGPANAGVQDLLVKYNYGPSIVAYSTVD